MASALFNRARYEIARGDLRLATDTIKLRLCTSALVPNTDTQRFWSDISTTELATGGGYTAGGIALANKTFIQDDASDRGVFDSDDVIWASPTTFTGVRYAVLVKDTGIAGTSVLLAAYDFGADKAGLGAAFEVAAPATGWLRI